MLTVALLLCLAEMPIKKPPAPKPDAIFEPSNQTSHFYSLAVSPNGKLLAASYSVSTDAISNVPNAWTSVWDIGTKKEIASLANERRVKAVAFSPDGALLASASISGTVNIHDVETWKMLNQLNYSHGFLSLAFSPDGKTLATGSPDGNVILWEDVAKKDKAFRQNSIAASKEGIRSLSFAPSGKQLASASDKEVRIWDPVTCKEIRKISCDSGVYVAAYSPDGAMLATTLPYSGHAPSLYDPTTGKEIELKTKTTLPMRTLCWSPKGKRLAVGGSRAMVIDFEKPDRPVVVSSRDADFETICFSPDGKFLYTGGLKPRIFRWRLEE